MFVGWSQEVWRSCTCGRESLASRRRRPALALLPVPIAVSQQQLIQISPWLDQRAHTRSSHHLVYGRLTIISLQRKQLPTTVVCGWPAQRHSLLSQNPIPPASTVSATTFSNVVKQVYGHCHLRSKSQGQNYGHGHYSVFSNRQGNVHTAL